MRTYDGNDSVKTDGNCPESKFRFRLRSKLLIGIVLLEALLLAAIILVVEQRMRASILDEFLKHATSVTRTLATVNKDFVMTYNYVKIDQHLEQAVHEHDLLYAVVLLFDGEVASYKEQEKIREHILQGELHERALQTDVTLAQYGSLNNKNYCDITVPIVLNNRKWGTVRIGFLLSDIQHAIVSTRKVLLLLGAIGLCCGSLASLALARRITQPVNQLVDNVRAMTKGEYNRRITIQTRDEIGYLGASFATLQETLKQQFQALADANLRLTSSNKRLQREIAERKKKEEQIHYLAFYDDVTDLPNRALLKEHLDHWLAQAKRHQREIAVLFLDLDQFKRINDTMGHEAGDELLCQVAGRLAECVRESDCITRGHWRHGESTPACALHDGTTVARLGGDEFVVVLTEINDIRDAALVARRINRALAEPFTLPRGQAFITTSIGISGYPFDGEDAETLLKHADMAMYHAKAKGRNGYQFYTTAMTALIHERLAIENRLRDSLKQDHFVLYYQPKADVQTGRIIGAEALIRWPHPTEGLIPPNKFISIAEETGLIIPLGEWIIRTACTQSQAWQAAGLAPLRISVNLSAAQFKQKTLPAIVSRALRDSGLEPHYLELELTESLLMEDLEASIAILDELKAIGVGLSIDDFGTGYSSLNYLKRFPIDTLKIDQSFVRDIANDPDDAAIVMATIALGHSLRLQVIAEGVEEENQLELLRSHCCDGYQGYLLSRPLEAKDFGHFIRKHQSQALRLQTPAVRMIHMAAL